MKTLFAIICFTALFAVGFGQTNILYYANAQHSVVAPGETAIGDPTDAHWTIEWGWNDLTDRFALGFSSWDPVLRRSVSVEFGIPLDSASALIEDETFLFVDLHSSERRTESPSLMIESTTFDESGDTIVLHREASVLSGGFTVHELVVEDSFLVSAAVTGWLSQGLSPDGRPSNYVVILYESDYPLDSLPSFGGTSVPEPSAYASILGMLGFGFALWARRKVRPSNSVSVG